jgi:hypothetical protein
MNLNVAEVGIRKVLACGFMQELPDVQRQLDSLSGRLRVKVCRLHTERREVGSL